MSVDVDIEAEMMRFEKAFAGRFNFQTVTGTGPLGFFERYVGDAPRFAFKGWLAAKRDAEKEKGL